MALADIKVFLEDRLTVLVPGIDLTTGSRAQVDFVSPVLTKLGSDPFATDIDAFLADRFKQEFPDIFAGDPSAVLDIFSKPLQTFLEPFKRETQFIKTGQSLRDPSVLSDDDADALMSNWFEERDAGGIATGIARIYFGNPRNIQVDISNRFFTTSGLSYYPATAAGITSAQMSFYREGTLFFFDVPVQAEQPGSQYNLEGNSSSGITGVDGIAGVLKVTNPNPIAGGTTKIDTATFIDHGRQALSERSLNTRRGIAAKINDIFKADIRASQVIGANDPEMMRDLLLATSPGHAWLQGRVNIYLNIAYVQCDVVDGDTNIKTPHAGDTLFVYLDQVAYPWVAQSSRLLRLDIKSVICQTGESAPFQVGYMIQWAWPEGVTPFAFTSSPAIMRGGISTIGDITISAAPSLGALDPQPTVPSGAVHVFGHTDVFIRPVLQTPSTSILAGVYDSDSLVERETLQTVSGSDSVSDSAGLNFVQAGVRIGDTLMLEQGSSAGIYTITSLDTPTSPTLDRSLVGTETGLRYRVVREVKLDVTSPKIPRFPFGTRLANDLTVTIGSKLFVLSTNDMVAYGAKVGDVLQITSGSAAGSYTIAGFDTVLGGRGLLMSTPSPATISGVTYSVFTPLQTIQLPLVRLKSITLLDGSKQSTDIQIPPAEPVAVVPTSDFTSAKLLGASRGFTGCVLPDMTGLLPLSNVAAPNVPGNDLRYSLNFDTYEGPYGSMLFANGSYAEFDYHQKSAQGSCSYFLATTEELEGPPPVDPNPGDVLTIKSGPNAGGYLVKSVYKFKYLRRVVTTYLTTDYEQWAYFIQIQGSFPVDPLKQVIDFLNKDVGAWNISRFPSTALAFPDYFLGVYASLGTKMDAAFSHYGATSPGSGSLQQSIDGLAKVQYEWGAPARGVLRTYFQRPTLFEQWTAAAAVPTTYSYKSATGGEVLFRPNPDFYTSQQLFPARLTEDTDLKLLPRSLAQYGDYSVQLTDASYPTPQVLGIRPGDVLEIHDEIFPNSGGTVAGSQFGNPLAIRTTAGSTTVFNMDSAFNIGMVGDLISIEQGADKGIYRIVQFFNSQQVGIDTVMSTSTPDLVSSGVFGSTSGTTVTTGSSMAAYADGLHWITIYGLDSDHIGTFKILTGGGSSCTVDTAPVGGGSLPTATSSVSWMVTLAPPTPPVLVGVAGTELYAVRPIHLYHATPTRLPITLVGGAPLNLIFTGDPGTALNYAPPFRIVRPNVRRINPTEMDGSREGSVCFFDTEVVSLSSDPGANLKASSSYLIAKALTYKSFGYRHEVDDASLTYSMSETGKLVLPTSLLPIGSADSTSNFLNLIGSSVSIDYDTAPAVSQLQSLLSSPQDRVTSADMLARHFLPTYVSYDATYSGGDAPSVVAQDIQSYLDTIPVGAAADVSIIESIIDKHGGNPITPTKVVALIHDWNRKQWLEMSENEVGGSVTNVPYAGTPRITYFTPGPDVSGQASPPEGPRINLTQG